MIGIRRPPFSAAPLLAALLSACSARGLSDSERNASLLASYRVSICRPTCADSLLVRGYLVLATPPDTFMNSGSGCFSLERMHGNADIYAGTVPSGELRWYARPGGPLGFSFYHSPDASYVVELHASNDGLRGTGRSTGFGAGEFPARTDSVIAERIGASDGRLCAPPAHIRRPSGSNGTE